MSDSNPIKPISTHDADDVVDPAELLCRLWQDGKRPNLDDFLAQTGPMSPEQLVEVLHVDQRERWQTGEPIPAETYLQKYPPIRENSETALDLIYSEFRFREDTGEQPCVEEYLRRFPQHREMLEEQFKFYRAMVAPAETIPYVSGQRQSRGPVRPIKVALNPLAGSLSDLEIQGLLRKRLRMAFLLIAVGLGIMVPVRLAYITLMLGPPPWMFWQGQALLGGVFLLASACAGVLLSKRPLSLGQLRVIELVLVGLGVALCIWKQSSYLEGAGAFTYFHREPDLVVLAAYHVLPWFALLAIYGLFVPNTWRRCAMVVGVVSLCPFAVLAADAIQPDSRLDGHSLVLYLMVLGFWMAVSSGLAILGSHHITVLRREASAARRLGQYQLKQRLGVGGMGEVYLAEHALLRRPCAIKLIRPERAGDPMTLLRFEREVQTTATLTHPNTVEIFDYGHAEDGTFYYVMEYLPGLSLEQLVSRHGPLPSARVVHLLRQVCGALQDAHANGLIHRDIKPGNVLVCERGGRHDVAKLLDFGLVHAHGLDQGEQKLTQEGAIAGTAAYMSPEQASGKADLDGRSDIYSLGAVAYFLLTGQPPFVRQTAMQTLAAHIYETPAGLDRHRTDIPADLQAVVLRCLEKDPTKRFPDADSLDQALNQCVCADRWTRERASGWWQSAATARSR
jgi:eukaryotic-like serine/threonine-protein kinase